MTTQRPSVPYADRERQAIHAFALSVLANPKSADADRTAARAALTRDDRPRDWKRVSDVEIKLAIVAQRVLDYVSARARGDDLPPIAEDSNPLAGYGVTVPDLDELRAAYPEPKAVEPTLAAKPTKTAAPEHGLRYTLRDLKLARPR